LRATLGRAGRARYEETYTPEAVLPVLFDTYNRMRSREQPLPLPQAAAV
jgi:hypothetical protein